RSCRASCSRSARWGGVRASRSASSTCFDRLIGREPDRRDLDPFAARSFPARSFTVGTDGFRHLAAPHPVFPCPPRSSVPPGGILGGALVEPPHDEPPRLPPRHRRVACAGGARGLGLSRRGTGA